MTGRFTSRRAHTTSSGTPLAARLARAGLLIGSLLLALVVAELMLGALVRGPMGIPDLEPPRAMNRRCMRKSDTLGWEPIPGVCGRNSLGLYGPEPEGLAFDATVLLVLGDSIAAHRNWVDWVERRLQKAVGEKTVAFNAGVSGYETCRELGFYNTIVDRLDHDVLLVQVCPNDLRGSPVLLPLTTGRTSVQVGTSTVSLPTWSLRYHLVRQALRVGITFAGKRDQEQPPEVMPMAACLSGIARQARMHGATPAAVLFPYLIDAHRADISPAYLKDEKTVRDIVADSAIPMLDLRPVFEDARRRDDGLSDISALRKRPGDFIHPSLEGQRIAGEAIALFLQDRLAVP